MSTALPPGFRWTNSALSTLQTCGERFRRKYIEKDYRAPSARQIRGTIVHRAARMTYQRSLDGVELPTREELADVTASEFEKTWGEGHVLAPDEQLVDVATTKANAKDFAVDLAVFHGSEVAPHILPVAVEHRITVKPRNAAIEIQGTIDLVAHIPDTGLDVIRDLKTTERAPKLDAAETSQQLTMYALIRLAEKGTIPVSFVLDFLVRTPARAEKSWRPLRSTRDREDIGVLVHRINAGVAAVEAGRFVPAGEDAWYCSAQWCEYHGDCPFVRRGARRPAT